MVDMISTWLESGQDYFTGVTLFERFGASASLKRIFSIGGATKRNRETLEYELRKIIKVKGHSGKKTGVIKSDSEKEKTKETAGSDALQVDSLELERKNLYKLLDNHHATLEFLQEDQRRDCALEILKADDRLKEIGERLEYFKEHGVLPVEKEQENKKSSSELTEVELIHRQMRVRTYVSRYKRLVANGVSLKNIAKNRDLLNKFQLELEDLNKRLRK